MSLRHVSDTEPCLLGGFRARWSDRRYLRPSSFLSQHAADRFTPSRERTHGLRASNDHPIKSSQTPDCRVYRAEILWLAKRNQRQNQGNSPTRR